MPHPDMYILTKGDATPLGLWTHIRQIATAHATHVMYVALSALCRNLPNPVQPLYITTGAA